MTSLNIYVHDLNITVGHSRALIELVRASKMSDKIKVINFVCYTADDAHIIFPSCYEKIKYHFVPFKNIKPVFLKIIFYHLYCFFHQFFFLRGSRLSLSLGMAYPLTDFYYLQFIHRQWEKEYFESFSNKKNINYLYKKLLYSYLGFLEDHFFKKSNKKFIILAKFMQEYLVQKYKINNHNIKLIYSGVNLKEFSATEDVKEVLASLKLTYSSFNKYYNDSLPTYLFVGAFERKGLDKAIEWINKVGSAVNFIVIGKSEITNSKKISFPDKTILIPHTNSIADFYLVSDYFIFPTKYEPFGLVLLEAFALGCQIITHYKNVGASEVIDAQDFVYFIDQDEMKDVNLVHKMSWQEKKELIVKRNKKIVESSWAEKSKDFYDFINTL